MCCTIGFFPRTISAIPYHIILLISGWPELEWVFLKMTSTVQIAWEDAMWFKSRRSIKLRNSSPMLLTSIALPDRPNSDLFWLYLDLFYRSKFAIARYACSPSTDRPLDVRHHNVDHGWVACGTPKTVSPMCRACVRRVYLCLSSKLLSSIFLPPSTS